MRTLGLLLALGLAAPAAAADDPKAVVEKAIKAHGGADLLAKYVGQRATLKGTLALMGMDVEVAGTGVVRYPDRRKDSITLMIAGQEIKLARLVTPDTVRITAAGQEAPLTDAQKDEERFDLYADNLTNLVPLLKGDYTLKAGAEEAVGGSPAVGVVVEHPKHKPVTLHFDKESGRLVRLSRPGTDDGGAEVTVETTFSDYKAVQGVQVPHKAVGRKDGKKQSEVTLEKVELLEKVDDSEFAAD